MTDRIDDLIQRIMERDFEVEGVPCITLTNAIRKIREWAGEQESECQRCHSKEKLVLCWKCADDLCADGIPIPQPVASGGLLQAAKEMLDVIEATNFDVAGYDSGPTNDDLNRWRSAVV